METVNVRSEMEETPIPPMQKIYNDKGSYLSQTYADYKTSQRLEIEKSRLKFLGACTKLKRPPPSLRVRGCSAIDDFVKLPKFSAMETELLNNAIAMKAKLINELNVLKESENETKTFLSKRDARNMKAHFLKKLKFYREQDTTKWAHWPLKCLHNTCSIDNNLRNYKLRRNRKRRKTERDAKRALESSSVIVMIKEDVPLGAIALLGKGLNYIPTPAVCPRQEQLDMRLAQNQILKVANQTDSRPTNPSCIPSSLFRTYYGTRCPADESSVNTIVNNMVNNHNSGRRTLLTILV